MRLTELEPSFVKFNVERNDGSGTRIDDINEADGIMFVCPLCLKNQAMHRPGVHSVICWEPSVPPHVGPKPGRWNFSGTGYEDLTLTAGSSSILLPGGPGKCGAHFFITNGEIIFSG
jgi:hypothetical protein